MDFKKKNKNTYKSVFPSHVSLPCFAKNKTIERKKKRYMKIVKHERCFFFWKTDGFLCVQCLCVKVLSFRQSEKSAIQTKNEILRNCEHFFFFFWRPGNKNHQLQKIYIKPTHFVWQQCDSFFILRFAILFWASQISGVSPTILCKKRKQGEFLDSKKQKIKKKKKKK